MKKIFCLAFLSLFITTFARDIIYDLNGIVKVTVSDAYELRQEDDLYTQMLSDSLNFISNAEIVFQQRNLSKLSKSAVEHYSRILLKCIMAEDYEFPSAYDDDFTQEDESYFAELVQDELAPGQRVISGPFVGLQTTNSGAKYVKVHYIRTGIKGSVTVDLCFFFNKKYALRAVFSYRTSEASIWKSKIDSAMNSVKWRYQRH